MRKNIWLVALVVVLVSISGVGELFAQPVPPGYAPVTVSLGQSRVAPVNGERSAFARLQGNSYQYAETWLFGWVGGAGELDEDAAVYELSLQPGQTYDETTLYTHNFNSTERFLHCDIGSNGPQTYQWYSSSKYTLWIYNGGAGTPD